MKDCITWTGPTAWNGRAIRSVNGTTEFAARQAWSDVNGPIPDGLQINHKCDNKSCVNPAHLYAGTQAQNMADTIGKPRQKKTSERVYRGKPSAVKYY